MTPDDKRKVGGSDVASILGMSRYSGPLSVWGRIVEGVDKEDSGPMALGRALEPVVLAEYARRTAQSLDYGFTVDELPLPWLRASLDARACKPGGKLRLVEAKTGNWRTREHWGEPGTGDIPREYLLQVQYYLGVGLACGALQDDVADVPFACTSDDASVTEADGVRTVWGVSWAGAWQVRYDTEVYEWILSGLERFWRDYVEPRRSPPPTALVSDVDFIRRRYPESKGDHLQWEEVSEQMRRDLIDHFQATWEARDVEARRDELAARIKMELGVASGVMGMPDGSRLDWKSDVTGKRSLVWRKPR